MELVNIAKKLVEPDYTDQLEIDKARNLVVDCIIKHDLKVVSLVQSLDSVLTNGSYEIRSKGVKFLCDVLSALEKNLLNEKEIEVLTDFLCLRLLDHKVMQECVLSSFMYFLDCKNKPHRFNKNLIEFLKTKLNVQTMSPQDRLQVYKIIKKVVDQRFQVSPTVDGDLVYSVVHLIEGEGNPENLMECFKIASFILKNFKDIEPYVDDVFEWLSSYYPVDYTPSDKERAESTITREDIVDSLYDCFFATPLNSENLQTLLLEKLESTLMSTKLESLNCLQRCYKTFPLDTIKSYTSSLWTVLRSNCLKKIDLVDAKILASSYETLAAMSEKLSEDDESYHSFIVDMYEELSIAFRKPEMDLFDPATRLIVSACRPRLESFEFFISKVVPIAVNAMISKEFKPVSGLKYLFEQLQLHHPNSTLAVDKNTCWKELLSCLSSSLETRKENLSLLKVMFIYGVEADDETLDSVVKHLQNYTEMFNPDIEECLALICANYSKPNIIIDNFQTQCDLSSLVKLADEYQFNEASLSEESYRSKLVKFSIYLRLILINIDIAQPESIKVIPDADLKIFLQHLREIAVILSKTPRLVDNIGQIHAIIFNKLDDSKIEALLMDYVSSNFCQKLIPQDSYEATIVVDVYLPMVKWVMKALVLRNHKFSVPFTNLLLNLLLSQQVDWKMSSETVNVFLFVVQETSTLMFNSKHHYRVFVLFRQKIYTICRNEIRVRFDKQDDAKKDYLLGCLMVQLSGLSPSVFRKDHEWLVRESIKTLQRFRDNIDKLEVSQCENILDIVYSGLDILISNDPDRCSSSFLSTLVDLNIHCARDAKALKIRKRALDCLRKMTTSLSETELLILRPRIIDQLKASLSDKKRLVRQAAAEARLKWILIGQPVGGG